MTKVVILHFLFVPHNQFCWPFASGCKVKKSLYKGSTFYHLSCTSILLSAITLQLQLQEEKKQKWFAFAFSWIRLVRYGGANRLPDFVPGVAAEPASPTWRPPLDFVSSHFIGGLGEPLFALSVELLSDPIANLSSSSSFSSSSLFT